MINFESLILTKANDVVVNSKKQRYIIGCDPFIISDKENCNMFVIYDKHNMKIVSTVETKKPFDQFVEDFLKGDVDKTMYKISKKFINATGNGKTAEEIRSENQVNLQSFKGDSTAF